MKLYLLGGKAFEQEAQDHTLFDAGQQEVISAHRLPIAFFAFYLFLDHFSTAWQLKMLHRSWKRNRRPSHPTGHQEMLLVCVFSPSEPEQKAGSGGPQQAGGCPDSHMWPTCICAGELDKDRREGWQSLEGRGILMPTLPLCWGRCGFSQGWMGSPWAVPSTPGFPSWVLSGL